VPDTSCVRYVSLSGPGKLTGTITGTTYLENSQGVPACEVLQVVRSGGKLYGGDYEFTPYYVSGYPYFSCNSTSPASAADTWAYTAGGLPLRTSAPFSSSSTPEGTAILRP
jgi:hypothetical protein